MNWHKKRWHLLEFEDQTWFPKKFRNYITDILGKLVELEFYLPLNHKMKQLMEYLNCYCLVDLCTGSGEAVLRLRGLLQQEIKQPIKLILTDKYPNQDKIKRLSQPRLVYLSQSIDALSVPKELIGIRTIFASFHHFLPQDAQAILQDAVNKNMAIGIFEYTTRSWKSLLPMLLGLLYVFTITPFIKPLSASRIFWTYIVPIVPLVFFIDGMTSNLRTYHPKELKEMIGQLADNHFEWEVGQYATKIWFVKVTYLLGWPKRKLQRDAM